MRSNVGVANFGLVAAVLLLAIPACDLEGDYSFPSEREYEYRYSAFDSTGFEVVTGSIKFKFEFTRWGCTSEKCGDIRGSWDFVSRVTPPRAEHPTGTGRVGGILTKEFLPRMSIGPDSRGSSAVLDFQLPPKAQMVGTWTSPSGEGGATAFREK